MPEDTGLSASVATFLDSAGKAAVAESDLNQQAARKAQDLSEMYREVGAAQRRIQFQKDTAEITTQAATKKAAAAAGVDPSAASDMITELMSAMRDNNKSLLSKMQWVKQAEQTRFLDDPGKFLIEHSFSIPGTKHEIQQEALYGNILSGRLNDLNNAIQQTAVTQRALSEPLSQAVLADRAKVAAMESEAAARNADIVGIKYNSAAITDLVKASKQQIDTLIQYKGTKDADMRLGMALESHSLQREHFDWQREKEKVAAAAKAEGKTIDDMTLAYINQSLDVSGKPRMSKEEFAVQSKLSKKSGELEYHLENGRRISTFKTYIMGAHPAESLYVAKNFDPDIPDIQQETMQLIEKADEMVRSNPHDVKDVRGLETRVNTEVKARIAGEYSNIRKGSVLDIGDLSSYITGIPEIKRLPVVKKILSEAMIAKMPLDNPKLVLDLTVKGVQDGKITSSEAQGLADVYRRASQINMAARGFTKFGVIIPENGSKYKVTMGRLFHSQTVDMNNPTEIGAYVARSLANPVTVRSNEFIDSLGH